MAIENHPSNGQRRSGFEQAPDRDPEPSGDRLEVQIWVEVDVERGMGDSDDPISSAESLASYVQNRLRALRRLRDCGWPVRHDGWDRSYYFVAERSFASAAELDAALEELRAHRLRDHAVDVRRDTHLVDHHYL